MDPTKIALICCGEDAADLQELEVYLQRLVVPEGMTLDFYCILGADSRTTGYQEAMEATDAKYKIYMHPNCFLIRKTLLLELLSCFKEHPEVGMVGTFGCRKLAYDGIFLEESVVGLRDTGVSCEYKQEECGQQGFYPVEAVDDYFLATQYDLPWRTDLGFGWHLHGTSQAIEFRKKGYQVVVLYQETPWVRWDQVVSPGNEGYERDLEILVAAYQEFLPEKEQLRILCPNNNLVAHDDIPWALQEMGHEVQVTERQINIQDYKRADADYLADYIRKKHIDLIISHDFGQCIAEACYEAGIPYIAWAFDAPLQALYTEQALYPTNYIFSFDKKLMEQVADRNIPHLYSMPLAANCNRVSGLLIEPMDEDRFACDISMIGSLYDKNVYERLTANCSLRTKQEIDDWIRDNACHWDGKDRIHHILSDETMEEVQRILITDAMAKYNMPNRFFYEDLLSERLTNRERVMVLNHLARKHKVCLYTGSDVSELTQVTCMGRTGYDMETPKIFHLSKINLNITLRRIESGLPQRIFDIMAVGGLVMTNYQPEIEDIFVPDQDIVVFHDLMELEEKVTYYLTHERERLQVAMQGYQKVTQTYHYGNRLEQMISRVQAESGLL